MTTVLDLRKGRSVQDFIISATEIGRAPALRSDHEMLVEALKTARDVRGPLAWLAHAGLTPEEWEGQMGKDAIPHALQENLKGKIAADRAALAAGVVSTQALDMVKAMHTTGVVRMALPYKEERLATYTAAHHWLQRQAQCDHAMTDLMADHIAEAPDMLGFHIRLDRAKQALRELAYPVDVIARVATARYGQRVLREEALAYEEARRTGTFVPFESGPEGMRFQHWLASSGLGGVAGQAQLALDTLEIWVTSAQQGRKGPCEDDCTRCPFIQKDTHCADSRASH